MDMVQNNIFSKEIEIVLLCSSINLPEQDLGRIKHLSTQNIDWRLFKKIILKNRTYVIAYKNLKLVKESIPEKLMSDLKELAISTGARNFFFAVVLQRLVEAFNKQDIFMLPFKGPALAEQVYRDIILRPFSDLDILVSKSDAVQAFDLLKKRDLIAQFELTESQFKKYIKDEDHFQFYDPKNKIFIELHWEISGLYLYRPLAISDLAAHITDGTMNGKSIPWLFPEALLVYLCIHGSKHGWEYLEQLCCVAEIIKKNVDLDWKKIERLSLDWQCRKMLLLGLYLSVKLLKAHVPDRLQLQIDKDDTIARMADEVIDNIFNRMSNIEKKSISDRFSSFHIRIRDSFLDKIRYALRLIFRPTDKEWLYFPVPACVSFVHYLLRPCRLLICTLRGENA